MSNGVQSQDKPVMSLNRPIPFWEEERGRGVLLFSFGSLLVLLSVLYAEVGQRLVQQWWTDPDYGHGFLVPLFSAYVIWQERARLSTVLFTEKRQPSNIGLLVLLGAVGLLVVGTLGAELFLSRISLLVLLAGMILFLAGWSLLRALLFPLGYLLLMIPLPVIIYNQLTFPLQLLASRFATVCLQGIQIPVLREGNLIILPNYTLAVVEACSGIRSLLSLIALALAYGYLAEKRIWVRTVLVFLVLPIAVASNGLRIMGTGVLTYFWGSAVADGFFHLFSGWLVFATAMGLLFLVHWLLHQTGRWKKVQADG